MRDRQFDTAGIINRSMDDKGVKLPDGIGFGALRHAAAEATRKWWGEIILDGLIPTVCRHRSDFTGHINAFDLLDANFEQPIPDEIRAAIRVVMEVKTSTPADLDDVLCDAWLDHLAFDVVASHVAAEITGQTGNICQDETYVAKFGATPIHLWSVK